MKSLNNLSQIQYEQANERLTGYYKKWYKEIKEKTDLVGDKYSNPYYIDIPHNWFETKLPRILIVGEEGYGTYGAGKADDIRGDAIEEIQEITGGYVAQQLGQEGGDGSKVNTSAFWKRFREIAKYGVCCWSNIDKIHVCGEGKGKLAAVDRKNLHSIQSRILQQEIEILQPDLVVFFGWHGISLKHELPEVFAKLYPGGLKDCSVWFKKVVDIKHEGTHYLFTYHPAWGYRNKKIGYEDAVVQQIKNITGFRK